MRLPWFFVLLLLPYLLALNVGRAKPKPKQKAFAPSNLYCVRPVYKEPNFDFANSTSTGRFKSISPRQVFDKVIYWFDVIRTSPITTWKYVEPAIIYFDIFNWALNTLGLRGSNPVVTFLQKIDQKLDRESNQMEARFTKMEKTFLYNAFTTNMRPLQAEKEIKAHAENPRNKEILAQFCHYCRKDVNVLQTKAKQMHKDYTRAGADLMETYLKHTKYGFAAFGQLRLEIQVFAFIWTAAALSCIDTTYQTKETREYARTSVMADFEQVMNDLDGWEKKRNALCQNSTVIKGFLDDFLKEDPTRSAIAYAKARFGDRVQVTENQKKELFEEGKKLALLAQQASDALSNHANVTYSVVFVQRAKSYNESTVSTREELKNRFLTIEMSKELTALVFIINPNRKLEEKKATEFRKKFTERMNSGSARNILHVWLANQTDDTKEFAVEILKSKLGQSGFNLFALIRQDYGTLRGTRRMQSTMEMYGVSHVMRDVYKMARTKHYQYHFFGVQFEE